MLSGGAVTSSMAELKLTRNPVASAAASVTSEMSPLHSCNVTRRKPKKEPKPIQEPQVCPKGEVGAHPLC